MISGTICVQTTLTSGERNCDQKVELVKRLGAIREEGRAVEEANSHAMSPATPEDQKWKNTGWEGSTIQDFCICRGGKK